MSNTKTSIDLIANERQRQIDVKGWSLDHDKKHEYYELTKAAICYADRATHEGMCMWQDRTPNGWPFEAKYWKPEPRISGHPSPRIETKDAIRMLVKAGALIAAEIDNLLSSCNAESITE